MSKLLRLLRELFPPVRICSAARRIPSEVYQLITSINLRYAGIDLDGGEFLNLGGAEKLQFLIEQINRDPEVRRLVALSGLIGLGDLGYCERIGSRGFGVNLCMGKQGLYIYDWDDYQSKNKDIPASAAALAEFDPSFDSESLRATIVGYTDKKSYIQRVADFRMFQRPRTVLATA